MEYIGRTAIQLVRDIPKLAEFSFSDYAAYFADIIKVFVAGSGDKLTIGTYTIDAIGMPWFLFALFGGRILYDYLHLKCKRNVLYVMVCICSIVGVILGKIQWLPFSFDIALAIQPFFLLGEWLKKYDIETKTAGKAILWLFVWAASFLLINYLKHSYLNLASRTYPLFPICYVCAIAGTMAVSCLSQLISRIKTVSKPLMYLGKNSIVMLCVHCFDRYYRFAWKITGNESINLVLRLAEDILAFAVIMLIINLVKKRKLEKDSGLPQTLQ